MGSDFLKSDLVDSVAAVYSETLQKCLWSPFYMGEIISSCKYLPLYGKHSSVIRQVPQLSVCLSLATPDFKQEAGPHCLINIGCWCPAWQMCKSLNYRLAQGDWLCVL